MSEDGGKRDPILSRAAWMILGGLAAGVVGGLIAWNGRAKPGTFDEVFGLPPAEPNMGMIIVGVGIAIVGVALLIAGLIGVATQPRDLPHSNDRTV